MYQVLRLKDILVMLKNLMGHVDYAEIVGIMISRRLVTMSTSKISLDILEAIEDYVLLNKYNINPETLKTILTLTNIRTNNNLDKSTIYPKVKSIFD